MILTPTPRPGAGRVTLDQLLQHNAGRSPDAPALIDAPDRPLWTEGGPRRLTWGQIDASTNAIASRLIELGLVSDNVVAIQGPNSSDTILAILGCIRAGLVPALMPAGWRKADTASAVERIGAKAIFASTRAGTAHPSDTMRYVAAENFAVRFICGFGLELPDGVMAFEDCIVNPRSVDAIRAARLGNPAEHVAVMTFDCGPLGYFPVARSHNEWLAAGLSLVSELGLGRDAVLLATLSCCSFGGLATGLVPWLMTGSTMLLHQAFDATVLGVQIEGQSATHLILPEVALEASAFEGLLDAPSLVAIASLVRRVDRLRGSIGTSAPVSRLAAFGEIGLVNLRDTPDGAAIPLGAQSVIPGADAAGDGIETGVTKSGIMALRGAMVPRAKFPGTERGATYPVDQDGWVATGFPARMEGGLIHIEGPRQDVVSIGGHSIALAAVDSFYADAPGAMAVNAIAAQDAILGERLAMEAMPEPGAALSAAILATHAESKGMSPLAITLDASIGDRRKRSRLAGAA
jgi:acyl-CoA synthetase (AMP-forming)/AMP-acid ligase II